MLGSISLAAPTPALALPSPANRERRSVAASWKRDVTLFAVILIVLVIAVAAGSGALMWLQLQETSASELQWTAKLRSATVARQATLEVDRLLMKTIALKEPDAVRAAAVASIAAATKVEDAVNALKDVLPGDAAVGQMSAAVDEAKAPRMRVIGLARRGDAAAAIDALTTIAPTLQRLDELSSTLLQRLYQEREEAARERQQKFRQWIAALGLAAGAGVAIGGLFYALLMRRLKRVNHIEHLLAEVQQGSQQLTEDGARLGELNDELRESNEVLAASVSRFRESFSAMDEESTRAAEQLGAIAQSCDASASNSRTQATHAAGVAQHIGTTVSEMAALSAVTQELGGSQQQIADFTERITRIAATTRLLSMNAAVEAARAGDAGRGFNVVAQSIRQLSDDTQAAVGEIRRTNQHIAESLRLTVDAVQRTGAHMNTCSEQAAALQASAGENCELVAGVAQRLGQFRAVLQRQAERVHGLEADVAVLDRGLAVGSSHVRRQIGRASCRERV